MHIFVRLYTILAAMAVRQGDVGRACEWLRKAKETALRFDAAPQFRTRVGLKFYHGSDKAASYDDMGQTAMASIEVFLADEEAGRGLRPLWAKICAEQ